MHGNIEATSRHVQPRTYLRRGRLLREGLQQNGTLQSLDLRQNQMSLDTVAAVDEVCKRNQLEYDKQRRDVREKLRALAKANTAGAPAYA